MGELDQNLNHRFEFIYLHQKCNIIIIKIIYGMVFIIKITAKKALNMIIIRLCP